MGHWGGTVLKGKAEGTRSNHYHRTHMGYPGSATRRRQTEREG